MPNSTKASADMILPNQHEHITSHFLAYTAQMILLKSSIVPAIMNYDFP